MAKNLNEYQSEACEFLGEELKHPRLGAVLGLAEELGELIKEIMELEIYSKPQLPLSGEAHAKLSAEAGDILFSLFEVCTAYNIDLATAYEAKFAKISAKKANWLQNYAPSLIQRRAELD